MNNKTCKCIICAALTLICLTGCYSNYYSSPGYYKTDRTYGLYNTSYQASNVENELRELNWQNTVRDHELRKAMSKPYDYHNRGGDWME